MRQYVPAQTALVLGGGGAKGAYEVGAIAALEELGIRAGSVYGTSVGAINAAIYAQGRMELAEELWASLQLTDVVTPESLSLADKAEELFDRPDKVLEFISLNAQQKGIDIAPLVSMLHHYIDEDAVRAGGVRLGLVTTRFPTLAMVEKRLSDMEKGSLHDWILASTACFPVFPMKAIGNERYVDGGFCDNTPVGMALRDGAKTVIALDIGKQRSHAQYDGRPNIVYIRTAHPLGGLMTFDPERSRVNRALGYYDTMRAFGRYRGTRYTFDPLDAQRLYSRACDFVSRLTRIEADLQAPNAIWRGDDSAPLFSPLQKDLPPAQDEVDYFLRACELCADIAQVPPAQVLTFDALVGELHARLPLQKAEDMLGMLLGGRIGALFSPPQPEKKLVVACLYHLLKKENMFSGLALRTLAAFPREMLCALTLREIL